MNFDIDIIGKKVKGKLNNDYIFTVGCIVFDIYNNSVNNFY